MLFSAALMLSMPPKSCVCSEISSLACEPSQIFRRHQDQHRAVGLRRLAISHVSKLWLETCIRPCRATGSARKRALLQVETEVLQTVTYRPGSGSFAVANRLAGRG